MRKRKRSARKSAIKNKRSDKAVRKQFVGPKTIRQYFAMSKSARDEWNRVTHVVTRMKEEDVSLAEACREFHLNTRTVIRLGRTALTKRYGRYAAKQADNLLRVLVMLTSNGLLPPLFMRWRNGGSS